MNKLSDKLLNRFPRVHKFLKEHPEMDLDQALAYTENLENKLERDVI